MTTAAYSAALDAAYRATSPSDVIFAVKQAIINQIRELDPGVSVRTTEFFSHSFAPDIVLSWKNGSDRSLFVRQDVTDEQIQDDLALMQREHPIIFGLEPAFLRQERLRDSEAVTRDSSTLVTDASGVAEVAERKTGSRVVRIAAPALLQGGRGVIDERSATAISTGLARGFVAAGNLATEETRDTVRLIEYSFQSAAAGRMIEFLRAVWIGAGGSSSDFPGAGYLQSGLTDEALEFLLEFEQNGSLDFWRRVGINLTLERILGLELKPSRNLNSLVIANLDRITARACGVSEEDPASFDDSEYIESWHRRGDALAWRSEGVVLRFGESKDAVRDGSIESDGLPLNELLRRASQLNIPFESVELLTSDRKIEYGLSENAIGQDVIDDPQLRAMGTSLGTGGVVRRAVASIPESAALVLDFAGRVGSGRTAARYALIELISYAVPLLSALRDDDNARLRSMVELNRLAFEPPRLF